MSVTVAQLGARALRKLGIAIVADAARPAEQATVTADTVAARVLLDLGIPVPESARRGPPSGELGNFVLGVDTLNETATVTQSELAARALRAVGVNPAIITTGAGTNTIYTAAEIATATLLKLAVIAADETPSDLDQAYALARVTSVHDILAQLDFVTWTDNAVPSSAFEQYVVMTANLVAPGFGKPASMEAFTAAQAMLRQQALAGPYGQSLAEAKVAEVHESLNSAGLVSWSVTAVPLGMAEPYARMASVLLAPVMGVLQDAPSRQVDRAAWDAAVAEVRKAAVIAGAQDRATAKVQAIQAELNDLGLVTWTSAAIPASIADPICALAVMQMGPEFGREFDPKMYAFEMDRVRRVSMGGPAGQALAEQKIKAVHYSLEARGRARWTLWNIPSFAEEDYVLMAATLLGPECGVKPDPAWAQMAEMDLMRIVSLPSNREPVIASYL